MNTTAGYRDLQVAELKQRIDQLERANSGLRDQRDQMDTEKLDNFPEPAFIRGLKPEYREEYVRLCENVETALREREQFLDTMSAELNEQP